MAAWKLPGMAHHLLLAALLALVIGGAQAATHPHLNFNPKTANWKALYSGYPQPVAVKSIATQDFKCLSTFALCAYANCTINFHSVPPVAECGCVSVNATQFPRSPVNAPFNIGNIGGILDKSLRKETATACKSSDSCLPDKFYNSAPFCKRMMPAPGTKGKAAMFGARFDLISTFNGHAWPSTTTGNQGKAGPPKKCLKGGVMTNCFSAGCIKTKAWNGMDTTCYCPIYHVKPGTPFVLASTAAGYACHGQKVDGKLKYVQNGV